MSSNISTSIEISHAKKTLGDLERKKVWALGSLSDSRKKYEALDNQIRYLKGDDVTIVSIAEYKTLLHQRNENQLKIAIWIEATKQLNDNIKLLQERCRVLELENQEPLPDPEPPMAKILEFPSAKS